MYFSAIHAGIWEWPVEFPPHQGAYVDDYRDNGGVLDYEGGNHTYSGHGGTDIAIADFRLMDKGVFILAVSNGDVTATDNGFPFDRGTTLYNDGNGFANKIVTNDANGTQVTYAHLRYCSIMVKNGDKLKTGQPIAYMGSSGSSPWTHLHLQTPNRDPFQGSNQPQASLWRNQPVYARNLPIKIIESYIFTKASVVGDPYSLQMFALAIEGISSPKMVSVYEETLYVSIQYQGKAGESYSLVLLDPANLEFDRKDVTLTNFQDFSKKFESFTFRAKNPPKGFWKLQVIAGGAVKIESFFEVGDDTRFPPRFSPIRGRSFWINGNAQKYALAVDSLGGPATFNLVNTPIYIGFDGTTVTIPGNSDQSERNLFFQAVATNSLGYTDTFFFHVVDMSKPYNFNPNPVSFAESAGLSKAQIDLIYSNPYLLGSPIIMRNPKYLLNSMNIYSIHGQKIRTLGISGSTVSPHYTWDGKSAEGKAVSAGVYLINLDHRHGVLTKKIIIEK